jgi:TetR/AcrR family transcriptional repressor of lmrAB and yxaGH operons
MSGTKEQIIETAGSLIERQGYHATGLNEIVKESGAPKGSLYYYFPEGKDQITEQAIAWAAQKLVDSIQAHLQIAPGQIGQGLRQFIEGVAQAVERSNFCSGGPLQAVALETSAGVERLNQACRSAYDSLQGAFQDKLVEAGMTPQRAGELALFITAALEGAILLSRTYHSGEPLRQVGVQIEALLPQA